MTLLSNRGGKRPDALPSRLPTLTGIRVIPAILVFLFHANLQGFFASDSLNAKFTTVIFQGGWASLTFFFVLSGFVLTWALRPTDTAPSFYRRRILKIYPNAVITGVVGILLVFFVTSQTVVYGGQRPGVGTVIAHLFLVQSWSPDWLVRTAINPPAWSLSCEVLFYALFPLLFALVKRIRPERLWAWFIAVAAVPVAVIPTVAATLVPHDALIPGFGISLEQFWFIAQFPPSRAFEFVLGMLLARIVISGRRIPVSIGGAVAVVVAGYAAAPFFPGVLSNNAVLLVPVALLVARLAVTDSERKRTWFSSKLMVRLGDITFAFYLWHQLVLMYGDYWLGDNVYSTPVGIAVMVLMLAVSLALAYVLFTFVETPVMRRWSGSRRKRPVLEPVATEPPDADEPTEIRRAS